MRFVLFIICSCFVFGCVKRQSSDPKPIIEFKSFTSYTISGRDTAVLTIGYQDGDGDIFRDKSSDDPNLVATIYIFNSTLNKFEAFFNVITNDTLRFINTIIQPDVSYKGKQVRGDIAWPMTEFRPNAQTKKFYYRLFMVDMKNNKSNTITTPTFTTN